MCHAKFIKENYSKVINMAEDDIYGSKKKYERFKSNLDSFLVPPTKLSIKKKYYCKNKVNLNYFKRLFIHFESIDMSYIRRLRLLQTMRFLANYTSKELCDCDRDDINEIMAVMHQTYNSPRSKVTFIRDLKHIWKILMPELDEKGRPDETIMPYIVKHLSCKIDKSKEKRRKDKFTMDEFDSIINYFGNEPRIQAYLTLSLESLARPQELLYVKVGDVELYDNYAKVFISEHGKEGVGLLQCIDSYPYLIKWINIHPQKKDKNAFLFVNTGLTNTCRQLKPANVNKMIRKACKDLKIDKPITCYSLKRNGVTIRRLRGETDMEIQHAARWTSTKMLKTYDLSNQDEAFKLALEKKGIIKSEKQNIDTLKTKECPYCDETVGFGETICTRCKHPLDREVVLKEKQKDEYIKKLEASINNMENKFENIKQELMQEFMQQILDKKTQQFSLNRI
jgi:integrase/recombinase XerD